MAAGVTNLDNSEDTSVVGWQVMVLKSASDAGLGSYDQTNAGASRFLDAVQVEVLHDRWYGSLGTQYAYQPSMRMKTEATTAIGLACRIYMGTTPFMSGMQIAVKRIAARGPIGGDMDRLLRQSGHVSTWRS